MCSERYGILMVRVLSCLPRVYLCLRECVCACVSRKAGGRAVTIKLLALKGDYKGRHSFSRPVRLSIRLSESESRDVGLVVV